MYAFLNLLKLDTVDVILCILLGFASFFQPCVCEIHPVGSCGLFIFIVVWNSIL